MNMYWVLGFVIGYVLLFSVAYSTGTIVQHIMLWFQLRSHNKWRAARDRARH